MKTHFTILFCAAFVTAGAQVREVKVQSTIRDVTVFLAGAQVTRSAIADVPPGSSTLILSGISPSIREESIQAEAADNVKILAVSFRVNHLEELKTSDQINALQRQREKLKNLISQEQGSLTIYEQEESMLNANKVIGGNQTGVNVADLKTAVSYYRERMKEIVQFKQQCQVRLLELGSEIATLENQLKELHATKPKPVGEIVVKVSSRSAAKASLKLSYLVEEASWFPQYDIRARDVQSPIAITYKATVAQQSGEDWKDVNLTVSSGNPSMNAARPIISTWILGFNNRVAGAEQDFALQGRVAGVQISSARMVSGRVLDETGQPMPGANVLIKGTTNGTVTDVNGNYSIPVDNPNATIVVSFIGYVSQEVPLYGRSTVDMSLQADVTQLSEVVVMGYAGGAGDYQAAPYRVKREIAATPVVRQTNVEFHVTEPFTISSNGESENVELVEYSADAEYQYYCAPKLDNDAFLTARLTGWDEYNFIEGEASLFFEGKYLGKTIIDSRNTSDTLTLSLGRDRNVVVSREKVKEVSSSVAIGSNRKNTATYEIKIRNRKAEPISIRIEDQVPVPNTREILVDTIEDSDAATDKDTGLKTWNLTLQPGQSQNIRLQYAVKYPKYSRLILE